MSSFEHSNFEDSTPDLILPQEQIDKMLNLEVEEKKEASTPVEPKVQTASVGTPVFHGFKPIGKAAQIKEQKEQQQTEDPQINADARIAQVEAALKTLLASKEGVKLATASKKAPKLDYSKLTEKDVYDLDIPIEAITHDLPDTMLLDLRDPTYIGRWVSTNAQRLGSMKAMGFTFMTKEDFGHELILAIETDENGWYRYNDVVAMKIPKEKYLGALRKNHIRAMSMVSQQAAQQIGKKIAEQELASGKALDPEGLKDPDMTSSSREGYNKYKAAKKIEVYTPGI